MYYERWKMEDGRVERLEGLKVGGLEGWKVLKVGGKMYYGRWKGLSV